MKRTFLVTALLAALSCTSPVAVARNGESLLQTEGNEFQLLESSGGMNVTIPYSFRNDTGSKVLLGNCRGGVSPSLEMKRDGKWVTAWSPPRLLCLSAPIQIAKGEIFVDTLHVVAGPFGSARYPQFHFEDVDGTYRLHWDMAYWEREGSRPFPEEFKRSNEFLLEVTPTAG